jgi:hypothetical protein
MKMLEGWSKANKYWSRQHSNVRIFFRLLLAKSAIGGEVPATGKLPH